MAAIAGVSCGKGWGGHCAADDDCFFSREEWRLVGSLADVTKEPPPHDPSNGLLNPAAWDDVRAATKAEDLPAAVRLGWRLYHDPRLSGDGSDPRDTLNRVTSAPRPPSAMSPQLRISCADCHDPARHGSDYTSQPAHVSSGAGFYDVNTQQTLNVARFAPVFYWNGRTDSLWSQAAQVMESPVSMAGRREKTFWVIANCYRGDPDVADTFGDLTDVETMRGYVNVASPDTAKTKDFRDAYDAAAKAHVDLASLAPQVHVKVAKAIAAYEWFLTSDHSRFDAYVAAGPASTLLTPAEKRGLKLFVGHAGCINCHNTSMFSDGKFHDIGVGQRGDHVPTVEACTVPGFCDCRPPAAGADGGAADGGAADGIAAGMTPGAGVGGACLPAGAYAGVQKLHAAGNATSPPATTVFRRCSCYDDEYRASNPDKCVDGGVGELHGCPEQAAGTYDNPGVDKPPVQWLGSWRTPSLRDVAVTAPYMHDGAYATLSDVIWHYDQGVASEGWGTSELSPLDLTNQDRADLVAFLGTLTGAAGPPALIARPEASRYTAPCTGLPPPGDGGTGAATDARDAPVESPAPMPDGGADAGVPDAGGGADVAADDAAADDGDGP